MIAENIARLTSHYQARASAAEREGRGVQLFASYIRDLALEYASLAQTELRQVCAEATAAAAEDRPAIFERIGSIRQDARPKVIGFLTKMLDELADSYAKHPERAIVERFFDPAYRRELVAEAADVFERRLDELLSATQEGGAA